MGNHIQVTTTTENEKDALEIARSIVQRRLAACVQVVGPVTSTYRWQGEVETAREWQCQIKTRHDVYEAVEAAIVELHSYDVPEIIATEIVSASEAYGRWIDEQVDAVNGDS